MSAEMEVRMNLIQTINGEHDYDHDDGGSAGADIATQVGSRHNEIEISVEFFASHSDGESGIRVRSRRLTGENNDKIRGVAYELFSPEFDSIDELLAIKNWVELAIRQYRKRERVIYGDNQ